VDGVDFGQVVIPLNKRKTRGVLMCFSTLFLHASQSSRMAVITGRSVQLPTSHDPLLTTAFDLALKVVQIKLLESTGASALIIIYYKG
jgi:hypothetical protein